MRPDLSVIIVSWNVRDLLRRCLASIPGALDGLQAEVIVVDNGSRDETVKMVQAEFPEVALINHAENVGFAWANNEAIRKSRGDFLLILNPDTELPPGALRKLLDLLRDRPEVWVAGCRLLNLDGSRQPSFRRFPTLASAACMLLKLQNLFPNLPPLRRYYAWDVDDTREQSVDQLMGAFLVIRRQAFDRIGVFDERFSLWFEEVDFCKRVKDSGGDVRFFPQVEITHAKGESFGQVPAWKRQWVFTESLLKYFRKHGSPFSVLLLALLRPVSLFLTLVSALPVLRMLARPRRKKL